MEMAENSMQFQNALQVVGVFFKECMIWKCHILSLIVGNGPLDNLSYISSYESGHFYFVRVALKAKKSCKRPWENQQRDKILWYVFQLCQLYYLSS